MDVEENGSVSNATQDGSMEDEMNVEGKARVASVFEKSDKVMENDLKEHINPDNVVEEEDEQMYITNSMEVVKTL
jgi:histone deacetylase complex regulatory component SIN3